MGPRFRPSTWEANHILAVQGRPTLGAGQEEGVDGRALELFPAVVQVTNLGRILGLWGGSQRRF